MIQKKPRGGKRSALNYRKRQESIAFDYHELLTAIVRDLENIDKLIPVESSRNPLVNLQMSDEARYIIVARKDDLLGYIQTICRDHIEWGKKRLADGWTVDQSEKRKRR